MVAKLEDGEYMAFGLSGDPRRSKMIGGDVTVAWMDHSTGKGYAEDYYLDAKSQCAGDRGSCPDNNIPLGILYSIIVWAFACHGYTKCKKYQRKLPLKTERT